MDGMVIREEVRRLPAYDFRHNPQPVKLDQNEAPDDQTGALAGALAADMAGLRLNRYPQLHPVDLEEALARRHGWDAAGVVVTNGSNVLIQALVIAAGLGRSVLTVSPTFSVYASQARLLGAELVEVPLGPAFEFDADGMIQQLAGRSGVAFIADPAAPTGNRMDPEAVSRFAFATQATGRWLTVIDEAYVEFAGADHLELARRTQGVAVLRTFSKAAGLAGARLGYMLTTPDLAENVRKALLPFSVSSLQVAVAMQALSREDLIAERVSALIAERRRLSEGLASLPGVEVFPSVANFVLFRVHDAGAVHAALLQRGVVIRRQDHLPGLQGCLRVTAGHPHENDTFLSAMESALLEGVRAHG